MSSDHHATELAHYALGWTITNVEPSRRSECWWKLTLCKEGRQRTLHLGASLGAWVEEIRDEKNRHLKFDSMVREMSEHACDMEGEHDVEKRKQVSFILCDDPQNLDIGFQCPLTGKMFISRLVAVKDSAFSKELATVAGRQKFADDLWNLKRIY